MTASSPLKTNRVCELINTAENNKNELINYTDENSKKNSHQVFH